MITTRRMTADDSRRVAEIHTDSWRFAYKGIVEQTYLDSLDVDERAKNWRSGIEADSSSFIRLVSEENGVIQAFCCGLDNRRSELLPESDCELWAIYADPKALGRGHGITLLERFKAELRALGRKKMCVWVLENNRSGRTFYENHGGHLSKATQGFAIAEQPLVEVSYEFDIIAS